MSKLSFRARALDPCKPMPIFLAEELPDLPEYSAINRAVPQMPSGMEKEEESEHHLQRAICTGLIIPTPEVFTTDPDFYERCYPANYKMPRQLIHMQPLGLEQDIPDYDMDSADEFWMNSQARRLDLTPLKFEQMMDKLEKSSGQTVVTLNEAKALLRQDDEVSTAVYDYWLNKRLKTQHPLILSVKTENRSGTAANNPYLAFRRRTEKMQTRKNRKNDETSYEKMLKLRRDLSRAVTLLDMVKKREKTKREQLHLSIDIFEKRYQVRDFSGSLVNELNSSIKSSRPAFAPIYPNQYSHHSSHSTNLHSSSSGLSQQQQQHHHYSSYHSSGLGGVTSSTGSTATKRDLDTGSRKEKRQYKKRKHKLQRDKHYAPQNVASPAAIESTISSEDEEMAGSHMIGSEGEDEGLYSFRRNKNCDYHRPLTKGYGNWPWESQAENGLADPKYRFTLTSVRHPRPRCVGFARRRVGRGGRMILDRISTNADDLWSQLDYTIVEGRAGQQSKAQEIGGSSDKNATTLSSEDENVSRDMNYVSSSFDRIDRQRLYHLPGQSGYIKQEVERLDSNYSDVVSYSNTYSNLCSRLISDNEASYSSSHRENNIGSISGLLNRKIKQEIPDEMMDVSGDDWTRLERQSESQSQSQSSLLDQRDSSIVVDLVRTQCINRISNRNISNNNNNNNHTASYVGSDGDLSAARTLFSKRHTTNEMSNNYVIKDELATVIKRECETDTNNSDDDNVNLASLSNILHAQSVTGAAEVLAALKPDLADKLLRDSWKYNEPVTNSNFVDLNTSTKLLQNTEFWQTESKCEIDCLTARSDEQNKEECGDKETIYAEFLEEIRKNWLHFHPKTPPPESPDEKALEDSKIGVSFTEQTPISVELQRVNLASSPLHSSCSPTTVFTPKIEVDPMFVSAPFSYNDLAGDEQLLMNVTTDSSSSAIDFNLSGDSLTELNLSLGEDENEKMLENILEECQMDDLKTLNQTSNFWDGILEDGGLLDVIDDKKAIIPDVSKAGDLLVNGADAGILDEKDDGKRTLNRRKDGLSKIRIGSSQFTIANVSNDEKFFSKEEPTSAHLLPDSMKCEPPEELLEVPQKPQPPLQTLPATVPMSRTIGSIANLTGTPRLITGNSGHGNGAINPPIKILIKQESPASLVSTSTPIVTTINQVPINHLNASQVNTTHGINIKLKNDCETLISNMIRDSIGSGTATIVTTVSSASGAMMTPGIVTASNNINANVPSLLMTSINHQQHQSHPTSMQSTLQQPAQQHIIFRQITQSSQTPQVNATMGNYTTDGSGAIVIATSTASPTKRHINGPGDKTAIQNLLKQRYPNRNLNFIQQTVKQRVQPQQQQHMQIQQSQLHQDDEVVVQTTQKPSQLLKIPSLPVIVPDLNYQQQNQNQQHTQQQQNTMSASAAVAVAANHNYSLQPTAQPITIIGHQQQSGNKIILNTSTASGTVGGANFAIATPLQDLPTKIQYGQLPSSNIKVNLVTSTGIQQGSLIMDAKNSEMVKSSLQQHQQAQITVATGHQQGQGQHGARKTVNMFIDPDHKRVLCKLVNLSSLQPKNSAGQTVQVSSGAAAHLLNKAPTIQRLGNSAIVANVRTLAMNNQIIGSGANVVASSANVNSIVVSAAQNVSAGDLSTVHKTQATNSGVGGGGSGSGDSTANVVSSGINLNTTNR